MKDRYKISFEEGGTGWCLHTNDENQAMKWANEKSVLSDHPVLVIDTIENKVIKEVK